MCVLFFKSLQKGRYFSKENLLFKLSSLKYICLAPWCRMLLQRLTDIPGFVSPCPYGIVCSWTLHYSRNKWWVWSLAKQAPLERRERCNKGAPSPFSPSDHPPPHSLCWPLAGNIFKTLWRRFTFVLNKKWVNFPPPFLTSYSDALRALINLVHSKLAIRWKRGHL